MNQGNKVRGARLKLRLWALDKPPVQGDRARCRLGSCRQDSCESGLGPGAWAVQCSERKGRSVALTAGVGGGTNLRSQRWGHQQVMWARSFQKRAKLLGFWSLLGFKS